jgi:hypothetical protein
MSAEEEFLWRDTGLTLLGHPIYEGPLLRSLGSDLVLSCGLILDRDDVNRKLKQNYTDQMNDGMAFGL